MTQVAATPETREAHRGEMVRLVGSLELTVGLLVLVLDLVATSGHLGVVVIGAVLAIGGHITLAAWWIGLSRPTGPAPRAD